MRRHATERGEDGEVADDEEHALYAMRPDEFVKARNDLARSMRKEGRRDDAARVAKLRRPSVAAWALNQVAREEPKLVDGLLDAGARLRKAMERAVKGDATDVRPAQAAERAAADAVTSAARRRLDKTERQGTGVVAQRITNTLRAAVIDDTLAQQLRDGILDIDVESSGFGFGDLGLGATAQDEEQDEAPTPKAARPAVTKSPKPKTDAAERKAEEAARRAALREEATRRTALRAEAKRLKGEADRLEQDARRAQQAADKARTAADRARARADAVAAEASE